METITYSSEAEGITEKPATNPETGLTDAQAVRKLLDVHYKNIETIKMMSDVIEDFAGALHARILARMHSFGFFPPEDEYDRWVEGEGAEVLIDAVQGNRAHLAQLANDLHERHAENLADVGDE